MPLVHAYNKIKVFPDQAQIVLCSLYGVTVVLVLARGTKKHRNLVILG